MAQWQRSMRGHITAVQFPSRQATCKRNVCIETCLGAKRPTPTKHWTEQIWQIWLSTRPAACVTNNNVITTRACQMSRHGYLTIFIPFSNVSAVTAGARAYRTLLRIQRCWPLTHLLHLTQSNKCVCTSLQRARRTLQCGRSAAGKQQQQQPQQQLQWQRGEVIVAPLPGVWQLPLSCSSGSCWVPVLESRPLAPADCLPGARQSQSATCKHSNGSC